MRFLEIESKLKAFELLNPIDDNKRYVKKIIESIPNILDIPLVFDDETDISDNRFLCDSAQMRVMTAIEDY